MPRKRVSQTSLEYWKQREDEARRIYQEQEQNYDEEISRIYNRMLKDIQLQINGFFGRYASSEGITVAEAKARADAMDVADFAEKAKKYVHARDFSKEANEALKLYNLTMKVNRLELLKANIGLEMCAGFDEMQKYFEQIMIDRVQDECERQSSILGETVKSNAKMAKSLVGASFNNASFSDRIWMYQGMLRSELSSLLEQGIVQGKHANELARHLEKRFGVSKFSAQRLMRTEMARVQTEAQKQSFEQIGYKQYIFIAEHDSRTCPVCTALDGMIIDLTKMMPGENAAPMHPMCRCSTSAYMDRRQFEKMVAKSNIPEKNNMSNIGHVNNGYYDKSLFKHARFKTEDMSPEEYAASKIKNVKDNGNKEVAVFNESGIIKLSKEQFEKADFSDISYLVNKLNNYEVRLWYDWHVDHIIDHIDMIESYKDKAILASSLRNEYRTNARLLMKNMQTLEKITKEKPNLTFDDLIKKVNAKGLFGDDAYKDIIRSSMHHNEKADKEAGVK